MKKYIKIFLLTIALHNLNGMPGEDVAHLESAFLEAMSGRQGSRPVKAPRSGVQKPLGNDDDRVEGSRPVKAPRSGVQKPLENHNDRVERIAKTANIPKANIHACVEFLRALESINKRSVEVLVAGIPDLQVRAQAEKAIPGALRGDYGCIVELLYALLQNFDAEHFNEVAVVKPRFGFDPIQTAHWRMAVAS